VRELATPTDVHIIRYHVKVLMDSTREFITRLYAKNPKYEPDQGLRRRKLAALFGEGAPVEERYRRMASHQLLTEAFASEPAEPDRVYLLGLGMVKSIREAYRLDGGEPLIAGIQLEVERLKRLHHNLSQVNWRLKTYRDGGGNPLFLANECGEDGYINMGYEVLMTSMLTRIEDDIYLLGGLPEKYFFSVSTYFLSIVTSPF